VRVFILEVREAKQHIVLIPQLHGTRFGGQRRCHAINRNRLCGRKQLPFWHFLLFGFYFRFLLGKGGQCKKEKQGGK
jgi:hypothetical protein